MYEASDIHGLNTFSREYFIIKEQSREIQQLRQQLELLETEKNELLEHNDVLVHLVQASTGIKILGDNYYINKKDRIGKDE